eukprot:SAG11_NODE_9359_length_919_cov_1.052439_2_plen_193_part_00
MHCTQPPRRYATWRAQTLRSTPCWTPAALSLPALTANQQRATGACSQARDVTVTGSRPIAQQAAQDNSSQCTRRARTSRCWQTCPPTHASVGRLLRTMPISSRMRRHLGADALLRLRRSDLLRRGWRGLRRRWWGAAPTEQLFRCRMQCSTGTSSVGVWAFSRLTFSGQLWVHRGLRRRNLCMCNDGQWGHA